MGTPGDGARARRKQTGHRAPPNPACDLYVPGHLVHYIQARKSQESGDRVRWGRFERVDEDGFLDVRFLDGTRRYRVHRPAEVAQVAEPGDKVRVSERWRTASISRRFEDLLTFCIALPDDPWRACSVASREPASPEELAQHLAQRGGFVVPGRRVTRRAGPQPEGDADPAA